jgi:fumarate hydratase class I
LTFIATKRDYSSSRWTIFASADIAARTAAGIARTGLKKRKKSVTATYQELLPLGADTTTYKTLSGDGVSLGQCEGRDLLKIEPEVLVRLAAAAMRDVSHLLRSSHLEKLAAILKDPEASKNDKFVALEF